VNGPVLQGRRVLVVGASAGIGRAVARLAIEAGADVLATARRKEALAELVEQAGGGSFATIDLASPDDCARLGREAKDALGAIDLAVFAAGTARLRRMDEMTAEDWAFTLNTNLVGINLAMAAISPHLSEIALVAALSTESVRNPFHSLGSYAASKAALEDSLRAWRGELHGTRFTCVTVGQTFPTEFGANFEPDRLGPALDAWAQQGKAQAALMDTDQLAEVLLDSLAAVLPYPGVSMDDVVLRSAAPHTASAQQMHEAADYMGNT